METALKFPYAGIRSWAGGISMQGQGTYGRYWSSSPNGTNGYFLYFGSSYIYPSYYSMVVLSVSP